MLGYLCPRPKVVQSAHRYAHNLSAEAMTSSTQVAVGGKQGQGYIAKTSALEGDRPKVNSTELFPRVGRKEDRPLIRALLQKPRAVAIEEFFERHFAIAFGILIALIALILKSNLDIEIEFGLVQFSYYHFARHSTALFLIVGLTLFPIRRFGYFLIAFTILFLISGYWALASGVVVFPPRRRWGGSWPRV